LLSAAFDEAVLDIISHAHPASFVILLPKSVENTSPKRMGH